MDQFQYLVELTNTYDLNGVVVWLAMLTANPKVPGKSWSFSEGLACD
jgi:hypothetical protein